MFSAAVAVDTLVEDSAQFTGSTPCDRAEDLAVSHRHPLAKLLEIRRCVLPQAVRNRGHRLVLTRRPPKDLLDHLAGIDLGNLSQMQVDHRGLQAAVTEILLDDFQRDALFQQMRGVRMAQRVRTDLLSEVELVGDQLHGVLDGGGAHRSLGGRHPGMLAAIGWKQKTFVSMCRPVATQLVQRVGRQGNVAILGTLAAMNVNQSSRGVDVTDLQVQSFAEPQAHRIDRPEENSHPLRRAGIDDAVHLWDGDYFRERLGVEDFQMVECRPVASAGGPIEELEGRKCDAKRTFGVVFLVLEVHKIAAELVFADLIRGGLPVVCEFTDFAEIAVVGALTLAGQVKIIAHTLIERTVKEARLCHGEIPY